MYCFESEQEYLQVSELKKHGFPFLMDPKIHSIRKGRDFLDSGLLVATAVILEMSAFAMV